MGGGSKFGFLSFSICILTSHYGDGTTTLGGGTPDTGCGTPFRSSLPTPVEFNHGVHDSSATGEPIVIAFDCVMN